MKIEMQCCTEEQGTKLQSLDITAHSLFHWVDGKIYYGFVKGSGHPPAYTVAELGIMLPHPSSLNELGFWLHDSQYDSSSDGKPWYCCLETPNEKHGGTNRRIIDADFEAQARSAMLIYLLENNLITPTEVNERLKQ